MPELIRRCEFCGEVYDADTVSEHRRGDCVNEKNLCIAKNCENKYQLERIAALEAALKDIRHLVSEWRSHEGTLKTMDFIDDRIDRALQPPEDKTR